MSIAGVDGCKNGWIVVYDSPDGRTIVDRVAKFGELLNRDLNLIVIDVPIGLLEKGTRLADQEARRLLKARACCVFTAPLRPMLACTDYLSAAKYRLDLERKGVSRQSWAILPKIREVDDVLNAEVRSRVREGHPEVSFAHLNGGKAVPFSKHKPQGSSYRLKLLAEYFPEITTQVKNHPEIRADDVIDAYALLWTARRVRQKKARALPEASPLDSRGLLMQIWA